MLKKFSFDKINITKNALFFLFSFSFFFFLKLQLITVLLLICDSYMSWSARFVSLKLCVVFSIFDSVSFLLKFIFLFNIIEKPDTVLLQKEVSKLSDICMSWSSPKTDLVGNFFNLENQSFEKSVFLNSNFYVYILHSCI